MRLLHRAERNDAYLSSTEHDLLCRLAFAGVVGEPLSAVELTQAGSIIASHDERDAPDPFDCAPPLEVTAGAHELPGDTGKRRRRQPFALALARYLLLAAAGVTIVAACVWLFTAIRLAALDAL